MVFGTYRSRRRIRVEQEEEQEEQQLGGVGTGGVEVARFLRSI